MNEAHPGARRRSSDNMPGRTVFVAMKMKGAVVRSGSLFAPAMSVVMKSSWWLESTRVASGGIPSKDRRRSDGQRALCGR